jgi:hypothetical protein
MYIIAYLLTYSFYCILTAIVSCLIPPTGKSCELETGTLRCYDGLPCILIAIFREILQQIFKYTHCEFRSIHYPDVPDKIVILSPCQEGCDKVQILEKILAKITLFGIYVTNYSFVK